MARHYKLKDARETGFALGREGIAEKAIKAVSDFDGSYKGAMELCGKLVVLADCATFDEYWKEQVDRGTYKMLNTLHELTAQRRGSE